MGKEKSYNHDAIMRCLRNAALAKVQSMTAEEKIFTLLVASLIDPARMEASEGDSDD